jgi:hypothetical protein
MMKKTLFSILVFFAGNVLYAQVSSGVDAQDNLNQLGGMGNIVRVVPPMKEGVKGSPLLFESAINAIPFRNSRSLNASNFNLHLSENKLLIQNRNGLNFIDKLDLDSLLFTDSNRLFVNGNLLLMGNEGKLFEKITTKDGQTLYAEHLVQFIPANFQGAYSGGNNYDEYVKKINIYIMNDGQLKPVKFNAKWLKQNYSDYKKIEKYVFDSELKYNVYEDLNKILRQMR